MEFEDVKQLFIKQYNTIGFNLVRESDKDFIVNNSETNREYLTSESDITDYLQCEKTFSEFQQIPDCGICSKDYREHLVSFPGRRGIPRKRISDIIFGDPKGEDISMEISQASNLFVNYFRFSGYFLNSFQDNVIISSYDSESSEIKELRQFLPRPITIKIFKLNSASIESALFISGPLMDSCLFNISYLKNIPVTLAETWPRRQSQPMFFRTINISDEKQFELPNQKYNNEIIRFYQRALSTDDPVNRFLSFYQVLEYYFITVADENLYSKLTRRINDPLFVPSPHSLDRIIQDTLDHKKETDEAEMLRLVLEKFVDEKDLIEYINAYESHIKEKFYSAKRDIFGESVEVRLVPGHVIGNLSKRIKLIRNALVHSSDRYERKLRYIPSQVSEYEIAREIPILQYLAERVIIGSSSLLRAS